MERNIAGVNIPVLLIGDSAFRLSKTMMKPYPFYVNQNEVEQLFNYVLSKARRVVENAFGHLKARFRRIGKGIDNNIDNASVIIKACCVLHNFLNERNDDVNQKWIAAQEKIDAARQQPNRALLSGSNDNDADKIRQVISTYLAFGVDVPAEDEADNWDNPVGVRGAEVFGVDVGAEGEADSWDDPVGSSGDVLAVSSVNMSSSNQSSPVSIVSVVSSVHS